MKPMCPVRDASSDDYNERGRRELDRIWLPRQQERVPRNALEPIKVGQFELAKELSRLACQVVYWPLPQS